MGINEKIIYMNHNWIEMEQVYWCEILPGCCESPTLELLIKTYVLVRSKSQDERVRKTSGVKRACIRTTKINSDKKKITEFKGNMILSYHSYYYASMYDRTGGEWDLYPLLGIWRQEVGCKRAPKTTRPKRERSGLGKNKRNAHNYKYDTCMYVGGVVTNLHEVGKDWEGASRDGMRSSGSFYD